MSTKLIVFDYGETLIHEKAFDTYKANQKILSLAKENKFNISVEDLQNASKNLYNQVKILTNNTNLEISWIAFSRLLYDMQGLTFDISLEELELIFCQTAYSIMPIAGAEEALATLNQLGIEVAVLSNSPLSQNTLKCLLASQFPTQKFKFIMSSCEYLYKKPDKVLFDAMLNKSGYKKEELIFCGDRIDKDILGAQGVNIKGVLIDAKNKMGETDCIKITNLAEILNYVEK